MLIRRNGVHKSLEHTYRVANIGKVIAEKENLNVEAVIIRSWIYYKNSNCNVERKVKLSVRIL